MNTIIKTELGIPAQEGLHIRVKATEKRGVVFLDYSMSNSYGNLYAFDREEDPSRMANVSPEVWEYVKGYELGYTYLDYPYGAKNEEIYF